ncbi:hypothetical protein [Pectinatus brassicae]|uniref:Putative aldo/keto reductase-like oxidoreductase n=1 Tax=Pectinatus brassicae TaxID=862415 RepID=A0A840UX00_9FIRM|nr:hypothetical protein [Pectinatus brassicae]MBB5337374.1 putative aldo/keto reductase-like oxidoreductase [Pectinatus brassicae]
MSDSTQLENTQKALTAIDKVCSHCPLCSPDCPVAVAKRAMESLYYDLQTLCEEQK